MPFNLIFDSSLTNSWRGNSIFDCEYYTDFKSFLRQDEFNKQYKILWSIQSVADATITGNTTLRVSVDMGRPFKSQRGGLQNTNVIGTIFPLQSTGGFKFLQNTPHNAPLYINGIIDATTVKVQFLTDYNTVFQNGDVPLYVLTLYFEEVDNML